MLSAKVVTLKVDDVFTTEASGGAEWFRVKEVWPVEAGTVSIEAVVSGCNPDSPYKVGEWEHFDFWREDDVIVK